MVKVVISHEAKETSTGCYHLLDGENTASMCGTINESSPFASDSSRVLTREKAEQRELDVCGRCSYVADCRSVTSSEATD